MLLLLGCVRQVPDDSKDAAGSGDTGAEETGGGESGGGDETGETGDSEGADSDAPVADCLRFEIADACDCPAWTVDWSLLTQNLAGQEVTPRTVDGGAVYAYGLDAATVATRLCEGSGIEPHEVLDFEFWDAEPVATAQNVAPATMEGGSLLVRIDESGGAVHMYALFQLSSSSAEATLPVLDTSARWER